MDLENIFNPLMAAFYEAIQYKKGTSHITDLIIITIKSLLPSEDYVRVNIDYKRYSEEIKLWKYYRHGENSSLMNILKDLDPNIYWADKDDTIYYRIIPIILANKDYSAVKDEVIKNVLYTNGNIEILIETLVLSKLFYLLISKEEDIIIKLKEEVINLSQTEFLDNYKDSFRISVEEYRGNYKVEFEQNKIFALNTLNRIYSQKFKVLEDCIEVYTNQEAGTMALGKIAESFKDTNYSKKIDLDSYYKELGIYIYKLRKGRINPEVLKIDKYYLPDIFQLELGQTFYHSLLSKSKIIRKEKIGSRIIVEIESKSGIYRFTK